MSDPSLAHLSLRASAEWSDPAHHHGYADCPAWCSFQSAGTDPAARARHVAHRAAVWELQDRVELCVMQVISDSPTDIVAANLPTLYFWSAENAVFSDVECVEMACAIRRASAVLCGINGV
jgi:hypothetical protein